MGKHAPEAQGTMLFIPGYMRTAKTMQPYQEAMASCGEAVGLEIEVLPWTTPLVPKMAVQAVTRYLEISKRHPFYPVYLGGFSMGSVAMVKAARLLEQARLDHHLAGLYLMSLSPGFGEHYRAMVDGTADRAADEQGDDWRDLGIEQKAGLTGEPLPELHKPIQLYVGAREVPIMRQVARAAHALWGDFSVLNFIDDTKHNAGDPRYVQALRQFSADILDHNIIPAFSKGLDSPDVAWNPLVPKGTAEYAYTRMGGVALRSRGDTIVIPLPAMYCFTLGLTQHGLSMAAGDPIH